MITAVARIYIAIHVHGLATISPQTIVAHLVDTYGEITAKDLNKTLKKLSAPWDPTTGISKMSSQTPPDADNLHKLKETPSLMQHTSACLLMSSPKVTSSLAIEDWEHKPNNMIRRPPGEIPVFKSAFKRSTDRTQRHSRTSDS